LHISSGDDVTEMERWKKNLPAIFEIKKLWVSKERKSNVLTEVCS